MHIPAAYAATLAHVRGVFPGAMIAGGALRDLDNDRPVKDLDIFAPDVPGYDHFVSSARLLAPDALLGVMGGYENWATSEVVGVVNVPGPHGDFQLIGLSTGAETILPRLDFGLCQIGWAGDQVIVTPAYMADKAAKTFTLVRSDDSAQYDRSVRRFERLSAEKYLGWQFVDPSSPVPIHMADDLI